MPITVTSWNMQGAQAYADPVGQSKKRKALEGSNISDALNLLAHGTDVLALQEAGGAPADWNLGAGASNGVALSVGYIQVGTTRRQRHVFVVWYDSVANGGAANNRCSMAVLCRTTANVAPLAYQAVAHHAAGLRPLIGVHTPSGLWVYSIHAPSGNHNAASGVANSLLSAIPGPGHWLCAGDYNCQPTDMVARGYGGRVVAGGGVTHQNGHRLDFAVRSPLAIASIDQNAPVLISDHYSQSFRAA